MDWLKLSVPESWLRREVLRTATLPSSDVEMPDFEDLQVLRFYWNLRAEGAAPLMRILTSELNHAGLPFRFKVLNDASAFARCDAGVLYIRKSDCEPVAEILRRTYPAICSKLNQRVPAFTKALAPGLGLAEDPGKGVDSFGLHRCRLLADGLIRAHQRGKKSLPDRLRVVEKHFAENGIRLETPFLNSNSADIYDLGLCQRQAQQRVAATPDSSNCNRQTYLDTAARIGWRLARQAIWHEDRCNWLGFVPLERSLIPQYNVTFSALGPELYSGTSGVALFLAELYAATGEAEARRATLGAIRQALSRVDALPSPARAGLFTGWVGIALVAARLGRILQEEELLRAALRLVRRCTRKALENWECDLFYGKAGTIVGLLLLRDLLEQPSLLEACVRLASAVPSRRNLTGFSHGAAGIADALLELFHSTSDWKYRRAAEAAFRYERHWYDFHAQNWPDLREEPGQPRPSRRAFPFATAWCHGAPGITLSRLRTCEILKDGEWKAEAIAGLETTRQAVEFWLDSGNANYSLCHGLAGNAEVLLYGSRVLGSEAAAGQKAALAVAASGIERYGERERPWPCGTPAGETPGLMLGLAGIGYFYLRLNAPTVPLTVILRREEFSPMLASRAPPA